MVHVHNAYPRTTRRTWRYCERRRDSRLALFEQGRQSVGRSARQQRHSRSAPSQHSDATVSTAEMEARRVSRPIADAAVADDERGILGVTWSRFKELLLDFHFNVDRIFYRWVCDVCTTGNPSVHARMYNAYRKEGVPLATPSLDDSCHRRMYCSLLSSHCLSLTVFIYGARKVCPCSISTWYLLIFSLLLEIPISLFDLLWYESIFIYSVSSLENVIFTWPKKASLKTQIVEFISA